MSSIAPVDLRTTLLVPLVSSTGAEDAWRVFLARYWPRIVQWTRRRGAGRDDAEQIASEVLLKLSCGRALSLFDGEKEDFVPGYARSSGVSLLISWKKPRRRRAALAEEEKNRSTPSSIPPALKL